ncbi:class II fructose-bisphosphate aldolase [Pectinatus haikarae]|uniref:Fructose-bisphosphate aldolase class II n=1 Tax=Pectinatus haikarae TaxID=349096 RepID=A0ABT9YA06_9FIRM|nr:class II fructose-bisphosphate aldolase [Pectinatus haikarae]MDQ0203939.1 fructose-bisphosphate aldolase class II [Pectinatus haikarae]
MLINLQQALRFAEEKGIAIGSFNIYNVESLQAVLQGSSKTKVPVILSFGEAYDKHMPLEAMAAMVQFYTQKTNRSFVLHLDHSRNIKTIERALNCGFTSVMYDGSSMPLQKNIEQTKLICTLAHAVGSSVEGELGYMNEEDGSSFDEKALRHGYTSVAAAKTYAAESCADALAIAIGNAHGIYKGIPVLDFTRLQEIHQAIRLPLVLHGSSGIPYDALREAINLGIRKININTEISITGIRAARKFLAEHTDKNTRFEAMTKFSEENMAATVKEYLDCFTLGKI